MFKTEEIQSKKEEEEIGKTIRCQNKTMKNSILIELMEKDICAIKVEIEDIEYETLKREEKINKKKRGKKINKKNKKNVKN